MKIISGMRHFNLTANAISRGKNAVFLTKSHFWCAFSPLENPYENNYCNSEWSRQKYN